MNEQNNEFDTSDSNESSEQDLGGAIESATEQLAAGEATEDAAVVDPMESIDSGGFDVSGGDIEPTDGELAAMSSGEVTQESTPSETASEAEGQKAPPAYLAFIAAVAAHGEALGLIVKEQKGFFQFGSPTTGHRLYVAKQGRGVTRIDTTLPRTALVVNGRDLSLALTKANGRVACHVDPTVESTLAALEVLATYTDKIAAPKKATKAA